MNKKSLTRQQLQAIKPPPPTDTWHPTAHADVADAVIRHATRRIISETYLVNRSGGKLFSLIEFATPEHPAWNQCLGISSSHDRTLSLRLVAGARITSERICLAGELTLTRKHTAGLSLDGHISEAMDKLPAAFTRLENRAETLKATPITPAEALRDILKLIQRRVINSAGIVPILDDFAQGPPDEWNYYLAILKHISNYPIQRAMKTHRGLAERFGLK